MRAHSAAVAPEVNTSSISSTAFPRIFGAWRGLTAKAPLTLPKRSDRCRWPWLGVRLVRAILPTGEELIVVSNLLERDAEYLLASYRQRWQIERFHEYLKETLGLAHLYSFQQNGLAFLVHVAVLVCVLLLLGGGSAKGLTVDRLYILLKDLRQACGMFGLWRRNTMSKGQTRHLKKKKNL